MRLKIGDKVKFLNESGGGFVNRIISPSLVEINTADGFNIPYAVKDLLIVDDQGVASRFFDEDFGNHKASRDEEPIENLNQVSTELFKDKAQNWIQVFIWLMYLTIKNGF
jgi:hypothetical protein